MMKMVLKYTLEKSINDIDMPIGAEILQVHAQGGPVYEEVCMWALVERNAAMEQRTFEVVGTGQPLSNPVAAYRGTAHLRAGTLVLHVFELVKEQA